MVAASVLGVGGTVASSAPSGREATGEPFVFVEVSRLLLVLLKLQHARNARHRVASSGPAKGLIRMHPVGSANRGRLRGSDPPAGANDSLMRVPQVSPMVTALVARLADEGDHDTVIDLRGSTTVAELAHGAASVAS